MLYLMQACESDERDYARSTLPYTLPLLATTTLNRPVHSTISSINRLNTRTLDSCLSQEGINAFEYSSARHPKTPREFV